MPIWVFMVRYDGEMACSTHLTEKGAIIAAIEDVLEYLGVESLEGAKNLFGCDEPPEWDYEKIRKMNRDQLYGTFGEWSEKTWDHHIYECEIVKTVVVG